MLAELVRLAPHIRVSVKEIDRSRVGGMLDSHEIDLALGYVPEPAAWHVSELMFEDKKGKEDDGDDGGKKGHKGEREDDGDDGDDD